MTSYHGGKQSIGKHIAEEIIENSIDYLHFIKGYCEPFCGMLGVYRHIIPFCHLKYKAGDYNKSVIMMWKRAQKGWIPPTSCTEKRYNELKHSRSSAEKGFIGHQYSFAGQYFKGYRGLYGNHQEYIKASENVKAIGQLVTDVEFTHGSYKQFSLLKNYIIYCDPPYTNTSYYFDEEHNRLSFDQLEFWEWCLQMSKHNIVFVSEYSCPIKHKSIKKVYEKHVKLSGASPIQRKRTEKLYMINYGGTNYGGTM